MGGTRRKRRALERMNRKAEKPVENSSSSSVVVASRPFRDAGILFGGIVLGIGIAFWVMPGKKAANESHPVAAGNGGNDSRLTVGRLTDMPESELARVDIALMNLICAEGLPGRGKASYQECLLKLEQIAESVRSQTARNHHRFTDNPAEFENSEEFYKIAMLNTVLGEDFGLHYNPKKIAAATFENLQDQSFFESADDVFLSGLLGEHGMGTCASMPVTLVAVGRKLGYPLKLVGAKGHLFFRWDDGKVRRNFECTNGIICYPDAHYQKWPFPISDGEVKQGWYLRSLSPREELAAFLSLRGQVSRFHGRSLDAILAYTQANILHPNHPDHGMGLAIASTQQSAATGMVDSMAIPAMHQRDSDPLAGLREVEAINARNKQRMPPPPPSRNTGFRSSPPTPGFPR